ncbi:MAG: protease PrsW [Chloroflexota bacterium]|nr:MAG: protease PrsW [Chloroflexota bacterium]
MSDVLGVLLSIFFGFAPMLVFAYIIYWLDRYEKEPKILLGVVFFWGAVIAAGGAFLLNTVLGLGVYIFTGSELATEFSTGSLIAPIVEESLKGLAVFVVFLLFRREFDSILDGIVYASIVALGFAATENAYYIFSYGYAEEGFGGLVWMIFVRVFLVGWQHPFYTSFLGIGLASARLSRNVLVKLGAPLAGWLIAVFTHSMHNTLASVFTEFGGFIATTLLDWAGWLVMFLFVLWAIYREQRWIVQYLRDEVAIGVISPVQYRTACSAWAQSAARLSGLFSGSFSATNRFYQLTAELAHKKQQLASLGEESGNSTIIAGLRAEIARLGPFVRV